jgi:hypothetical protein
MKKRVIKTLVYVLHAMIIFDFQGLYQSLKITLLSNLKTRLEND